MVREYEVRIGPSAIAQILEAVQYVRDELCMPQAAEELFEELELRITGLSTCPQGIIRLTSSHSNLLALGA